ncbi:MAG: pyridoxamine 5'-phosphate oxidase family protein [Ruminiclostridium sp.]|nr:pyridoxamine 5'-phosphate oxidase family protein [Ruminiclostridium sp.]
MGCEYCSPVLSADIKNTITSAPFLTLVTVSKDGEPHTIAVEKVREVKDDDILVFGIYKMQKTRENLSQNGFLQIAAVSGKSGYRLTGRANFTDSEVIFSVKTAESLL